MNAFARLSSQNDVAVIGVHRELVNFYTPPDALRFHGFQYDGLVLFAKKRVFSMSLRSPHHRMQDLLGRERSYRFRFSGGVVSSVLNRALEK